MTAEEKSMVALVKSTTSKDVERMSKEKRLELMEKLHLRECVMAPWFVALFDHLHDEYEKGMTDEEALEALRLRGGVWP